MTQDYSAKITRPAQNNLAGAIDDLMIEKFGGKVYEEYQADSTTDAAFDMPTLVGTNTLTNNAMGKPSLVAVIAGVEPDSSQVEVGDVIVQVKTPIIARVLEPMLENVQDRLNIKGRLPKTQAKVISKFKDQLMLHKCVQSAMKTTGVGEITGIPGGFDLELTAAGDELDVADLLDGLRQIAQNLAENEIDISDGVVYILPAQFFALLNADKLIDANFSKENGDFAMAKNDKAYGLKLVVTTRLPKAAGASIMGTDYDISAEESDAVMCFAGRDAIMSAQSIPLTSDVYWDKKTLTWFIDTYLAFGSAVNRPDEAAVIRKYRA